LKESIEEAQMALMQEIKKGFDSKNILNTYKVAE